MRLVDRELIESTAEALGIEIRDNYSGKFMFGERCFGLVLRDSAQFARFMVRLGAADALVADRLSAAVRQDSLGLHAIYYFPGFALDGRSSDDEWGRA